MYKYLNEHPKDKRVGDCVKRAFTTATGQTYKEVSKELNQIKRDLNANGYNDNSVWRKFISQKKWYKIPFQATAGEKRMNGHRFCEQYPEGTYVLRMAKHLTVCVDGVIYDTWDCTEKCVYTAWEVK